MIRLYLDEDCLNHALVRGLRESGVDFLTTASEGRLQTADEAQLAFATSLGRVIYTANVGDYSRLHRQWLERGRHHAGMILLTRQRTAVGVQIRVLTQIAAQLSPETMRDRREFLGNWL